MIVTVLLVLFKLLVMEFLDVVGTLTLMLVPPPPLLVIVPNLITSKQLVQHK